MLGEKSFFPRIGGEKGFDLNIFFFLRKNLGNVNSCCNFGTLTVAADGVTYFGNSEWLCPMF